MQLDQLLKDRDDFLLLRTQQMEERENLIAERDTQLNLRTNQLHDCTQEINKLNEQVAEQERLNVFLNQQIVYRGSLAWWLKAPFRFILRAIKGDS